MSENLTATMTVDQSPEQVYAAIANVRGWWTENLIGDSAAVHDEFVFTDDTEYAGEAARNRTGIRYARFQVTDAVPGRRMVWRAVDSYLDFVDDHHEWTDTTVIFDITPGASGTTLNFTHEGLTRSDSECFDACSRGWTFYVTTSLPQLITTGTGQPIPGYR